MDYLKIWYLLEFNMILMFGIQNTNSYHSYPLKNDLIEKSVDFFFIHSGDAYIRNFFKREDSKYFFDKKSEFYKNLMWVFINEKILE